MIFNQHSNLRDTHAFLSPSQSSWLRYTPEKLLASRDAMLARAYGTELHAFAAKAISLGVKLQKSKYTINRYVNDAIGFGLQPEQVLYYSPNCYGTADAINYDEKKRFLRIHDLKTGAVPASMEQLMIYAAIFCLEYHIKPRDISIELRIYQFDDYTVLEPDSKDISDIMETIVTFDKILNSEKERGF